MPFCTKSSCQKSSIPSIPSKPTAPEDWACCQSECGDGCVHEIYRQEKLDYDNKIAVLKAQGVLIDDERRFDNQNKQ